MKIVYILQDVNIGGVETLTLDICKNARYFDLQIILVVTGSGSLMSEFINSGVEVINIKRKHPIDLSLILKLRKILKKYRVQIIHSHQAVTGLHSYFASIGTSVKNILSFHGYIPNKKNDFFLKYLIPKMDVNIAVSLAFKDRLSSQANFNIRKNFRVLYNGVDIKKFVSYSNNLRNELNLKKSDLLIGMIGNFNSGRDQLTICKALVDLRKKYSNLHFVFIGGQSPEYPNYYDECFDACKKVNLLDRVHFLGVRSDIGNILGSLDLYVYSSNHDSFGISVVEAMFSKVPVVINDLPVLLEITNNGKYAKVFKSRNTEDLVNKVSGLLDNPSQRLELKESAYTWAQKNYTIQKHLTDLSNLYKEIS